MKAIALTFALALTGAAPAMSVNTAVAPSVAEPLMPVTISIAVTNRERSPVTLEFPSPDLFFVQVRDEHGKPIFDSRSGHKPIPVRRKMTFGTGTTRLAQFDWNGLSDDRHAVDGGKYVVHVEIPSETKTFSADIPLRVETPVPIASILTASPKPETIAGEPERSDTQTLLRDQTGAVALSGSLGMRPQGRFFVRGIMQTVDERRTFIIDRFAPAAENLVPAGTPTPRVSASPAPASSSHSR